MTVPCVSRLGVLSLEGESRRQQCQTLLGEALTQLQTKLKNDQTGPALDFSFHIRNTELQLKVGFSFFFLLCFFCFDPYE